MNHHTITTLAALSGQRPRPNIAAHNLRVAALGGGLAGVGLAVGLAALLACACGTARKRQHHREFRVYPYVQNPAPEAMTVRWFAHHGQTARLGYRQSDDAEMTWVDSVPQRASALAYARADRRSCRRGTGCSTPYMHSVRLSGLRPDTRYHYAVEQGQSQFTSEFRTAPTPSHSRPVRVILYADCETEPESTGAHVPWADPSGKALARKYPVDQTRGYANNLSVMRARQPDLIAIAGDLVESGGEQQDWDEFWRHNTHSDGRRSLASQVPIVAAPGNHEYYAGPALGRYDQPHSEVAIARFLSYFEVPPATAADGDSQPAPLAQRQGRYHRLDYGRLTLIALDVVNDSPDGTNVDTSFYLRGEGDSGGGRAPAFGPGSEQYQWLHQQLRDAQQSGQLTVVFFHHAPYSVGPHGWPPGFPVIGPARRADLQSGRPVRRLTPLFLHYGVDVVVSGHDEMWERTEVSGQEVLPDGQRRAHVVHFYDVGIGGDGLRPPQAGLGNPQQAFLVHRDAPEVWDNGILRAGGKHYGHLEITLTPTSDSGWEAVLEPVYVLPVADDRGRYVRFERRVYDDVITLKN